jgi:C_GCAxxG_C_C family probable redox protein
LQDKLELSETTFGAGFNCAQSVLIAYAEDFGLSRHLALGLAAGFGGGIARQGQTCGVVSGALMVLGLKYGMLEAGDPTAKEHCYLIGQQFLTRFREAHGSVLCRELLGYDLSVPEQRAQARDLKLTRQICPALVRDAVLLTGELLRDPGV